MEGHRLFRFPKPQWMNSANTRTAGVYTSGALFALALFTLIDAATYSHSHLNGSDFHMRFIDWLPGIFSAMGMLIINSIDKSRLSADNFSYSGDGVAWKARVVLFMGFAAIAGGLAGGVTVMVLKYVVQEASWPAMWFGVANLIANGLVMLSTVVLWVSQNMEDDYTYNLALYKKRLADANDKIYSLEDQVVGLQQQLEQNAAATTTTQHTQTNMNIKMETDVTQDALEATTKRCEQFEKANNAFASFIATIEKTSGVPASELGDKIKSLQESVLNGSKIETALRTQVNNYEKKIKKAEKNTAKMKVELDEAQEKVQKLKADLFRAGLGHIKTPKFDWKKSASPNPPAAPKKKKKAMGMMDAAEYGDQDDSEPDMKKPIPGGSMLSPMQKKKRTIV
ncbi:UPF0220-domain-containing protein [Hortaea werneckii]|nr:UPF0220-domain-containing protein [Hortaea werneckii]KAI6983921.1 UPF0220-domain-containing protein [Hortaea werneckii]KAI7096607.1 UPF0220-domain-containing protein [Hortaea werneckii]KAI7210543.1 UPF0220-domain-containing protein [Hortaea werneckii]KAI7265311.1 UPF0220-domain-containing protein [Hortaea werneckii]